MEEMARDTLPPGMGFEWTDLTYQQILEGDTAIFIFPLCVLFVFLTLAALYESWSLPLAIILIVPMCLLFAIVGVWLRGMDNNIFTQIGFVVLVGLACKNAILIVEFAKQQQDAGLAASDAAVEASRLRLRPDLDDFLRLHFRRHAAACWPVARSRDAARAGHGRLQRHVGRDLLRNFPHARLLHRHPQIHGTRKETCSMRRLLYFLTAALRLPGGLRGRPRLSSAENERPRDVRQRRPDQPQHLGSRGLGVVRIS